MNAREQSMADALRNVCAFGLAAVRRPRDLAVRDQLRRASLHGSTLLKSIRAGSLADELTPRDPRPEPPLPPTAAETPAPIHPRFEPRLPYPKDD